MENRMAVSPLVSLTVEQFLSRLASGDSTPGGGSAAALAGALAAGLGQMACALTLGRKRFADVEPQVRELTARLERSAAMLRRLVDEDAAAYEELQQALRLECFDPKRAARVRAAAGAAAGVPFQTLAISARLREDLRRLEGVCNPALRCDVQAAAHLAQAAMQAAAANVHVNLPYLAADQQERVGKQVEALLKT